MSHERNLYAGNGEDIMLNDPPTSGSDLGRHVPEPRDVEGMVHLDHVPSCVSMIQLARIREEVDELKIVLNDKLQELEDRLNVRVSQIGTDVAVLRLFRTSTRRKMAELNRLKKKISNLEVGITTRRWVQQHFVAKPDRPSTLDTPSADSAGR